MDSLPSRFDPGSGYEEGEKVSKRANVKVCPDGGIGRRAGLKHQWIHFHPGSTPGLGTEKTPQIADDQRFEEPSLSFYSNMTETILCVYYILVHQYFVA